MTTCFYFFRMITRLQVNTCPSIAVLHSLQRKKEMSFNNVFEELNHDNNENQQTEVKNNDADDAVNAVKRPYMR